MRLIDADVLADKLKQALHTARQHYDYEAEMELDAVLRDVEAMPTIEPERNGKWITPQREGCQTWDKKAYAQCSICGAKEYLGWSKCFCPNCGADMRGEDHDN